MPPEPLRPLIAPEAMGVRSRTSFDDVLEVAQYNMARFTSNVSHTK